MKRLQNLWLSGCELDDGDISSPTNIYSLNNIVNLRINRIPGCINTVSFDPTSSRVAIGRKDGDIEITGMNLFYYNSYSNLNHIHFSLGGSESKWFCQATIPGISSHGQSTDLVEDRYKYHA